jgi:hypothetical protein
MYENKPTRGIINHIQYIREECINIICEHQNILNKIISILNKKKVGITLNYTLDLIDSNGNFISRINSIKEDELFSTKEELLKHYKE